MKDLCERIGKLLAAEKVEMQVLDALATVVAAVINDSVAVHQSERLGDPGNLCEDMRHYGSVFLCDGVSAADVLLRNKQYVYGSLRLYVVKRENLLVLINLFRGNRAVDNFAENAVVHSISPLL